VLPQEPELKSRGHQVRDGHSSHRQFRPDLDRQQGRQLDVLKQSFVATATAVGLIVDGARMPVYLVTQGKQIASLWPFLVTATIGTIIGTVAGERVLRRVPEPVYRRVVAGLVLALGVFMLFRVGR
jgi:uncharacterized membrane protein YfcA